MPSERYAVAKVEEHTIDVFCKSCNSNDSGMWHLGQLINAWEKVTGSRYMQVDASRKLKPDTITLGDSIAANKGTALEAWYAKAFHILHELQEFVIHVCRKLSPSCCAYFTVAGTVC